MAETIKYGTWYHVKNHYMPADAPNGLFLDLNGSVAAGAVGYMDASASIYNDRLGLGTATWRLMPISIPNVSVERKIGDPVCYNDTFFLQNNYASGAYLYADGVACQGCPDQNQWDVSSSIVKYPDGTGSMTAIWKALDETSPANNAPINQSVRLKIVSQKAGAGEDKYFYLDTCGSSRSENRNDVSLSLQPNRDSDSGTWSFEPYSDAGFKKLLLSEENIGPYQVHVKNVQCVIPSSGVASIEVFGLAAGIIGATMATVGIAATASAAAITTAVTAGAAAPAVAAISAPVALAIIGGTQLASQTVTFGLRRLSGIIGKTLPDQVYLKQGGRKIWPLNNEGFLELNAGKEGDVNWKTNRLLGDQIKIELYDHDIILSDDLLATFIIEPDREYVNAPLSIINTTEGSAYILYVTATKERSSTQILEDVHKLAMNPRAQPD